MPVDNLSVGMQAIGSYDLDEKIAEGGMGTVYRGRHRSTGEIVAVKVVPQHLLSNPVVLKRFEQEYNVARQITHPNIVKALDFGREGDVHFLVMEYVEGESLGQKIERDGRMEEKEAIRIMTLVAQGLQKAHKQGMIHRDIKPDNIMITASGEVKITDLGLVKELEADLNLTRTGRGLGTPHFMAPEQFRNAKKADVRCDIYSMGATLYMMVTGELPFQSNGPLDAWMKKINNEIDAPRKIIPDISERVDWAIRRSISPDPQHRPDCCREFIEDLTGHGTKELSSTSTEMEALSDIWYLVYTDDDNVVHTVKGTVKGIRRSLRDGLLGSAVNVRAARTKAGPFESLRSHPEFRDLVIQPEKVETPKSKAAETATQLALKTPTPSDELATTTIPGALQAHINVGLPLSNGPRIDLHAPSDLSAAEVGKWLLLGAFFMAAGVGFAVLMPYLRYVRLY
jgi:serine/threonine protein kinase